MRRSKRASTTTNPKAFRPASTAASLTHPRPTWLVRNQESRPHGGTRGSDSCRSTLPIRVAAPGARSRQAMAERCYRCSSERLQTAAIDAGPCSFRKRAIHGCKLSREASEASRSALVADTPGAQQRAPRAQLARRGGQDPWCLPGGRRRRGTIDGRPRWTVPMDSGGSRAPRRPLAVRVRRPPGRCARSARRPLGGWPENALLGALAGPRRASWTRT